jgi:hypothetical protein
MMRYNHLKNKIFEINTEKNNLNLNSIKDLSTKSEICSLAVYFRFHS